MERVDFNQKPKSLVNRMVKSQRTDPEDFDPEDFNPKNYSKAFDRVRDDQKMERTDSPNEVFVDNHTVKIHSVVVNAIVEIVVSQICNNTIFVLFMSGLLSFGLRLAVITHLVYSVVVFVRTFYAVRKVLHKFLNTMTCVLSCAEIIVCMRVIWCFNTVDNIGYSYLSFTIVQSVIYAAMVLCLIINC